MTDYYYDNGELASRVQLWGVLWKKPFGQGSTSNRWTKRFFVIKEGFLLYYPENEKREFEKRRYFNMHPKGVIPLGGCSVVSYDDSCKSWAFRIENDELNGGVHLATETENERERWCETMSKSARITVKNAELGDCMIQTLEKQSLELAKDSQKYRNQWHSEAVALRDEMDRNEELERMAAELEIEKAKIEETARDLQDEHERTRMELEDTIRAMSQVAHDKEELSRASHDYHTDLVSLAMEREKTMNELTVREETMKQLTTKNESLTWETQKLKSNLGNIERRTKELEDVMKMTESRLDEKKKEAQLLEEEKLAFSQHAQELQCSLNDLTVQKELTDAELRQEIMARRDAEFRLKVAEDSLSRLDSALQQSRDSRPPCLSPNKVSKQNELDSTINQSVSTLKKFFEEIAEEAKIDQDKPIIMKNALHARKSFIRKTKSFKYRKERSMSMLSSRQKPVKKIHYRKTMATEHDLKKEPNFERWKNADYDFKSLTEVPVNGTAKKDGGTLNANVKQSPDTAQPNISKNPEAFTLGRCNTFSLSSSTERIDKSGKQANTLPPGTMGFGDYVWDEEDGLGKPPVFNSSMFFRRTSSNSEPSLQEADVVSAEDELEVKDLTPTRTETKANEKNTFEQEVKELYASIDKWRVMNAEKDHEHVLDEILEKPAPRPTPAPRSSPPQARPRLKLSPPPRGRKVSPKPRIIPTVITSNYCTSSSDDDSSSADNERESSSSDSTATDGTFSGNELIYPSSPTFSPKPFSPTVTTTPVSPVASPMRRNRRIIGAAAGWKKQDASQARVGTTPTAEFMEKYAKIFSNTRKNIAEQEKNAVGYDTAL